MLSIFHSGITAWVHSHHLLSTPLQPMAQDLTIPVWNGSIQCSRWSYCDIQHEICKCYRGNTGIFQCDHYGNRLSIPSCYCLTLNKISNSTEVGLCLYNCYHLGNSNLVSTWLTVFYQKTRVPWTKPCVACTIESGHCVVHVLKACTCVLTPMTYLADLVEVVLLTGSNIF